MSYRDELTAALARNAELDAELARTRAALTDAQQRTTSLSRDLAAANAKLSSLGHAPAVAPAPASAFSHSLAAVAALAVLATLAMGARSESKGVAAAYAAIPLVGAWLGARRASGHGFARALLYAGIGAVAGFVGAVTFFQAIWPAL